MTKWLLERVDSFPKNQRFIFGQRIADRTLGVTVDKGTSLITV